VGPNSNEQRQVVTFLNEQGQPGWTIIHREDVRYSDETIRRVYECHIVKALREKIRQVDALDAEVAQLKKQEANDPSATQRRIATQRRAEQHREEMMRLAEQVADPETGAHETAAEAEDRKRQAGPLMEQCMQRLQPTATEGRAKSLSAASFRSAKELESSLASQQQESQRRQEELDKEIRDAEEKLAVLSQKRDSRRALEASVSSPSANGNASYAGGYSAAPMPLPSPSSMKAPAFDKGLNPFASVYSHSFIKDQLGAHQNAQNQAGAPQPTMAQPDYSASVSASLLNSNASYDGGYGAAPFYSASASSSYGYGAASPSSYSQGTAYSPAPQPIVPSVGQYYPSSNRAAPVYGYSVSSTSMPLQSQTLSATYSGVTPAMQSQANTGNAYGANWPGHW
jgi:hypothetical protein